MNKRSFVYIPLKSTLSNPYQYILIWSKYVVIHTDISISKCMTTCVNMQHFARGVSFNQILQSQVRESYFTVRESCITAYYMWSVIQSNPPISI